MPSLWGPEGEGTMWMPERGGGAKSLTSWRLPSGK